VKWSDGQGKQCRAGEIQGNHLRFGTAYGPKLIVDDELRLNRDEVHLRMSGTINLGKGIALNADQLVHFECSVNDDL
jgi:hypothetical protein